MSHAPRIITHAHWDREWFLTVGLSRPLLVRLFDNLWSLLERRPDYSFVLDGQMGMVEDYLQALDEEARAVAEARIRRWAPELCLGPHYAQIDWKLAEEAAVRNLTLGLSRTARYGEPMAAGWMVDNFGFPGQGSQLHRLAGSDTVFAWRGVDGAAEPCLERCWSGPDGARALLLHLIDSYRNVMRLCDRPEVVEERLRRKREVLDPSSRFDCLLQNLGHDSIAGVCIDQVHWQMEQRYETLRHHCQVVLDRLLQALSPSLPSGYVALNTNPNDCSAEVVYDKALLRFEVPAGGWHAVQPQIYPLEDADEPLAEVWRSSVSPYRVELSGGGLTLVGSEESCRVRAQVVADAGDAYSAAFAPPRDMTLREARCVSRSSVSETLLLRYAAAEAELDIELRLSARPLLPLRATVRGRGSDYAVLLGLERQGSADQEADRVHEAVAQATGMERYGLELEESELRREACELRLSVLLTERSEVDGDAEVQRLAEELNALRVERRTVELVLAALK